METDAEAGGTIEEDLMEDRAANAASWSCGKRGFGDIWIRTRLIANETDTAQKMCFVLAQDSIEIGEADGCEGFK